MTIDLTKDPDKMSQAELRRDAKAFRRMMDDAEANLESARATIKDRDGKIAHLEEKIRLAAENHQGVKNELTDVTEKLRLAEQECINIQARCDDAQKNASSVVEAEKAKVDKIRALAENIHAESGDLITRLR